MASSNGVITFRAGRGPSFILVGLVLIVVILFYSYWGVSSKNSKLLKDVSILQDRLRVLAARKLTADKKGSALITQITQLQEESGRALNMKDTKISQVLEQMQRKEIELETLQKRQKIHESELEKLNGEINKTSGNFKLLKGKAGEVIKKYEAMKANYSALQEKAAQLESEKQSNRRHLEAYKVEYQKIQQALAARNLIQTVAEKPKKEDVNSNGKKIEHAQPTTMLLHVTLPSSNGVAGNSLSISEKREHAMVSEEEGKDKEERGIKASPIKGVELSMLTSNKDVEQGKQKQAALNVSMANESLIQSHENGSVNALNISKPQKSRSEPEATKGDSSEALTGNQEGEEEKENSTGTSTERQQKSVNEVEDEQSHDSQESLNKRQQDDDQEDANEDDKQTDEGEEDEENEQERDKEGKMLWGFKRGRKVVDERDNIDDEKKTFLAKNPRDDSLKQEWFHDKDVQEQHSLKKPDLPESAIDRHRDDFKDEDDDGNFR